MRHKRDHPEYKYQPRRRRQAGGGTNTLNVEGITTTGSESIHEKCNSGGNTIATFNGRSPHHYKVFITSYYNFKYFVVRLLCYVLEPSASISKADANNTTK